LLQLIRVNAIDESAVPNRFQIDDIERMVETALGDAAAGHNVYVEARTVRIGLIGKQRGEIGDTAWVFGLVIDSDADKGKAGNISVQASLEVQTSPGNRHLWYLLDRAIPAERAKLIGEAMRASTRADHDTGVITQPYRIAGTPNFPTKTKQERGRLVTEPTKIVAYSGKLWNPDELLKAFSSEPAQSTPIQITSVPTGNGADNGDEATLPEELLALIKNGIPKGKGTHRAPYFHGVIAQLYKRHWSPEAVAALLAKYPNGIAAKFKGRIAKEVARSYKKIAADDQINTEFAASLGLNGGGGAGGGIIGTPGLRSGPGGTAGPTPRTIPTVRIVTGQLPQAVAAAERALISSGLPVFARAGTLVHPVVEEFPATGGHRTSIAKLRSFCADSLLEWLADSALFQRFSVKRNQWVDINPPYQIVRILLAREGRSTIPRISGVITTPTLRPDGSLLDAPGYDAQSELYLLSKLTLPDIPEQPSREQAEAALALLIDLLSEFAFVQPLDKAVALSGILTALVRGSLSTAPMYLIRAHTAGTGKSFLVDVIAVIASGRECPVITTSRNAEETEKRLGAIILWGSPIVSLDNCVHDLGGQLLCQLVERPVVKVRVLGRSEMPECQCLTAMFATGNNILLEGELIRRGVVCNLDALVERPELREFKRNPLNEVFSDRGRYVAAGLTIIRAYLTAGAPAVCGSLGSYRDWSRMVRSPLVWLGQPDPVVSMESAREEEPGLADIRELFSLWRDYLSLDDDYTVGKIIEVACATPAPNDFNPQPFRDLLLRVANDKGVVSVKRLGWWLRGISGRIVDGHRLNPGQRNTARASYNLTKVD
jgi:hypothetical protein